MLQADVACAGRNVPPHHGVVFHMMRVVADRLRHGVSVGYSSVHLSLLLLRACRAVQQRRLFLRELELCALVLYLLHQVVCAQTPQLYACNAVRTSVSVAADDSWMHNSWHVIGSGGPIGLANH
jgi:hypothetical protein